MKRIPRSYSRTGTIDDLPDDLIVAKLRAVQSPAPVTAEYAGWLVSHSARGWESVREALLRQMPAGGPDEAATAVEQVCDTPE